VRRAKLGFVGVAGSRDESKAARLEISFKVKRNHPVIQQRRFVSGVKVPTLEALTRYQVLSVASASVTRSMKRTQGGDGRQCESVKG